MYLPDDPTLVEQPETRDLQVRGFIGSDDESSEESEEKREADLVLDRDQNASLLLFRFFNKRLGFKWLVPA